ncbi:MAG: hypothetical protein K2P93_05665 [Alphaproteobacteria bacterium]|nr:hypothetical protein [Alphaproteobacteria bacterium]
MPHINFDNRVTQDPKDTNLNITNVKQSINPSPSPKLPLFFKKKLAHSVAENISKINLSLDKDPHPQVNRLLSHIEDPLWKKICCEVGKLMGSSSVEEIWDSELGSFCMEDKSIDLCCPTEEAAHFINQYSFLILGSLRSYFPAIKALKTKVRYTN